MADFLSYRACFSSFHVVWFRYVYFIISPGVISYLRSFAWRIFVFSPCGFAVFFATKDEKTEWHKPTTIYIGYWCKIQQNVINPITVNSCDLLFNCTVVGRDTNSMKSHPRPPDKSAYWTIIFFISHPKHMLWVLKRTVSMRRFFWAPKTHV